MATWDRESTLSGNGVIGSGNSGPASFMQTTSPQQNTTQSSTQTSSNQTQSQQGTQRTQATNMDPSSLAALQLLIKQLLGGGTQQMAQENARRLQEQQAVQAQRGQFSKEAAFSDAQGAMSQFLRQAMEQAMPALVRSAEGSGTSQNSMRALLTQDALTRASEGAAALGLNAATQYGTVGANYSSILERLTQPNNAVTEALLGALNIAKGAVTDSTTNTSGTTTTSGTQNQLQNQIQNLGGQTISRQAGDGAAQQFSAPAGGSLSAYSPSGGDLSSLTNAQWNALARATAGGGAAPANDWYSKYVNF